MTISEVMIKNSDQSSRKSTNSPLNEANVVRPKFPKEANNAYCVAENAWPVSTVRKETNATVENAVVKLSTIIVARNKCSFGPTEAIQANINALNAIKSLTKKSLSLALITNDRQETSTSHFVNLARSASHIHHDVSKLKPNDPIRSKKEDRSTL